MFGPETPITPLLPKESKGLPIASSSLNLGPQYRDSYGPPQNIIVKSSAPISQNKKLMIKRYVLLESMASVEYTGGRRHVCASVHCIREDLCNDRLYSRYALLVGAKVNVGPAFVWGAQLVAACRPTYSNFFYLAVSSARYSSR